MEDCFLDKRSKVKAVSKRGETFFIFLSKTENTINLNCHKIEILEKDIKNWRVKFFESNYCNDDYEFNRLSKN